MMEQRNNKKSVIMFILYFLGWWAYFTQGSIGIQGVISQTILVVMTLWSLYYYAKMFAKRDLNPCLKILNYLLIIFLVYGIFNLLFISHSDAAMDYVKKAIFSIIPIFGFYYFLMKIDIGEYGLMLVIIGLLLFSIGEFYAGRREMEEKIAMGLLRDRDTSEMVSGSIYRFIPIIPLLFFVKTTWFKYSALAVILAFAILGIKRGPLIICAISLFFIVFDELRLTKKRFSISQVIVFSAAIVGGYYMLSRMIADNDFLIYRIEAMLEGDTSDRDMIFNKAISQFSNEGNIIIMLFGNGADSTLRILGNYAHNDWLEIMLNNGLVGLTLYFLYYYKLFRQWRKSKVYHPLFMCIGILILSTIITSIVSMSINNMRISSHFTIAYSLVLADALPKIKRKTV